MFALAQRYGVVIGKEAKDLGEDLLEGPGCQHRARAAERPDV